MAAKQDNSEMVAMDGNVNRPYLISMTDECRYRKLMTFLRSSYNMINKIEGTKTFFEGDYRVLGYPDLTLKLRLVSPILFFIILCELIHLGKLGEVRN